MPKWSKQTYIMVADILAKVRGNLKLDEAEFAYYNQGVAATLDYVGSLFIQEFQKDNPAFNTMQFGKAAVLHGNPIPAASDKDSSEKCNQPGTHGQKCKLYLGHSGPHRGWRDDGSFDSVWWGTTKKPNLTKGNPGEGTLHDYLADTADHVDYEAAVVEEAADEIEEEEIAEAAHEQAEAMEDAAEALDEAADAARDTAAEVFNETNIPQDEFHPDEEQEEVLVGNPKGKRWSDIYKGNPVDDKWLTLAKERYAFPGGYEIYFVTDDGGILGADTVVEEWDTIKDSDPGDGWFIIAAGTTADTDEALVDDHTGRVIQSAWDDDNDMDDQLIEGNPTQLDGTLYGNPRNRKYAKIRSGNPNYDPDTAEEYWWHAGYERGVEVKGMGTDPEDALEPLSGEWAGESIPEIFGSWEEATEENQDAYEAGYWDALYGNGKRWTNLSTGTVAKAAIKAPVKLPNARAHMTTGNPSPQAPVSVNTPLPANDAAHLVPVAPQPAPPTAVDQSPEPSHWYTKPLFGRR